MLAAAGQLHRLLQCLYPIRIARARRAPAGLPTGRRGQASEPGKLEACKPLRGLQLPGYRRWESVDNDVVALRDDELVLVTQGVGRVADQIE
jgi:hypothetical protein